MIRCIRGFKDLRAHVWRNAGDEWPGDVDRVNEINDGGYGTLAEYVEDSEPATTDGDAPGD